MSGAVRRQPAWIACFVATSSTLIGADHQPQRYAETVNVASVLIDVRVLVVDRPEHADRARDVTVALTRRQAHVFATSSYSNSVR